MNLRIELVSAWPLVMAGFVIAGAFLVPMLSSIKRNDRTRFEFRHGETSISLDTERAPKEEKKPEDKQKALKRAS